MSPERFQQIRDLFERAVELSPEHRLDFVARCCAEDNELADEARRMLAADTGRSGDSATSELNAAPLGFPPGTILAQRYRIVNLIGQGGMGEVYRADDLLLAQPVALKFLPRKASADAALLARFRNEVRMARQVTHPNVCRVHDLGEADGLTYLTMEYVDGEDLGSLLRRIGKLPQDKAFEVARKIAAGLAAAHEKGVVHRDLKPANIMLDGKGQIRITDFGLAGVAEQIRDPRSGTPAYMSPEQRAGREVTSRSDIYALGIVLHELFTGKRPSRESRNTDLDPAVERAIYRCLEEDPRMRPATAMAVVAALPGGDPLAAALAAGEIPSPEVVANAGAVEGLRVPVAIACLISVIAGLATIVALSGKADFFKFLDLKKSPEALAQEAEGLIRRLGYSAIPTDRAYGFSYKDEALHYLESQKLDPRRWSRAAAGHPSPLIFWYRQSPQYLQSSAYSVPPGLVSQYRPYPSETGMIGLTLDPRGRLLSFYAVPPRQEESTVPAPFDLDDTLVFSPAGLDATRFSSTSPRWVPPGAFDSRRAWVGSNAEEPGTELRLEAAYWHGRLAYFEVNGPWSRPVHLQSRGLTQRGQMGQVVIVILFLASLAGGALLARYNVKRKRTDQRGAIRLAGFVFWLEMLQWCLGSNHVPTFWEMGLLVLGLSKAAYTAGLVYVLYLGLEPFVRRRWPQTLISWTRVLAGRVRDPFVGSHILIGVVLGTGTALLYKVGLLWNQGIRLSAMVGVPSVTALAGGRHIAHQLVFYLDDAISKAMIVLFLIFFLRLVVRKDGLAAALSVTILTVGAMWWTPPGVTETSSRNPVVLAAIIGTGIALGIAAFLWFGLLTITTGVLTMLILTEFPVTPDLSSSYLGTTIAGLVAVLTIAIYGYHTAVAGRTWLGDILLKE